MEIHSLVTVTLLAIFYAVSMKYVFKKCNNQVVHDFCKKVQMKEQQKKNLLCFLFHTKSNRTGRKKWLKFFGALMTY